ncbi:DUF72 domain-containing protein [Scopulibacillus darangshiensis]|nr:DUF72 domain-containing protein [Scopulibacillus darangshiensis]
MIYVGLTGWGDHPAVYDHPSKGTKLQMYSSHFPIVELDSAFYAILPEKNYVNWIKETPDSFSFIVKAYQTLTGHGRGDSPDQGLKETFAAFKSSIRPLIEAGKLGAVLFQYPPWFECTKENVNLLRFTKEIMADVPLALEFRNQSWFADGMKEKTLAFMKSEMWIHAVCDEPQSGVGSVPTVLVPTNEDKTIVRMHGRNTEGWVNRGQPNWREVRYLYRYNRNELEAWKEKLQALQKDTKDIYVLFNNNSGGDAADNANTLLTLLDIKYEGLAPKQLGLF